MANRSKTWLWGLHWERGSIPEHLISDSKELWGESQQSQGCFSNSLGKQFHSTVTLTLVFIVMEAGLGPQKFVRVYSSGGGLFVLLCFPKKSNSLKEKNQKGEDGIHQSEDLMRLMMVSLMLMIASCIWHSQPSRTLLLLCVDSLQLTIVLLTNLSSR